MARVGPVQIADDGTIYALGHEYVDYQTTDLVLLSYASDGTGPDWELHPHSGGSSHRYQANGLALDGAGSLYLATTNLSSPISTFYVDKYALDTGTKLWSLTNADIAIVGAPENWEVNDIAVNAQGFSLVGSWFDGDINGGVVMAVLGQFDGDGAARCYAARSQHVGVDPDWIISRGVALTGDGHPVGLGWVRHDPQADRWLARFGVPQ